MSNGSDAVDRHKDVLKLAPDFRDAELTIGLQNYIVGSLPLPLKMIAGTMGVRGSKKRGLETLERVAVEGRWSRDLARVLLIDLYKREKRWKDAVATARTLSEKYPRNYLFKLQMADALASQIVMLRKAKDATDATGDAEEKELLSIFESLLRDKTLERTDDLVQFRLREARVALGNLPLDKSRASDKLGCLKTDMTDHHNEELLGLIDRIKEFLRTEVYPLETDFLRRPFATSPQRSTQNAKKLKRWDSGRRTCPKSMADSDLSLSEFAFVSEELGRTPIGHYLFNCQAPDIGNMEILLDHGTPEQKEKYFTPLARGDVRSCFSMTEPEHPGSNPTWMSTTAVKDGDDYVINGHKWFTSSAEGASFAIVMAITGIRRAERYKRASQIIVPIPDSGFPSRAQH